MTGSGAAGGSTKYFKKYFYSYKFQEKDIKLYFAAPEPPDLAPVMPWAAGPCPN